MKKFINLSLGLSLVSFFALSSVNAQDSLSSAEGSPEIEEILVSASLIPIAASQSANAATIIDSEQIKLRAAQNVSDLLRDVPGLAVSSFGTLGSQTVIRSRGSEANHLVVMVDGIKTNDPSQDDAADFGVLSVSDIQRIEIIRGPQSALHGSEAIGGVINIITKTANKPFSASVFSEYGSRATSKSGFSIGHNSEKFSIRLGASHFETDGINAVLTTGDDVDGHRNTDVNLKATYRVSDQLNLSLSNRSNSGILEIDDPYADKSLPDYTDDYLTIFESDSFGISVDYNPLGSKSSHGLSIFDSNFQNDQLKAGNEDGTSQSNKQNVKYIGSTSFEKMSQRISWTLENEKQDYKQSGGYAIGDDAGREIERNNDSVALEYRLQPTDLITLAASLRYDDNDAFGKSNSQRVEAIFQGSDSIRYRMALGTAIKNPTFSELYGVFEKFVANPNLIPEESKSWELGVDIGLIEDRYKLSATYFNSRLENEIYTEGFDCDPVWNWPCDYYKPINLTTESEREGLELSSSIELSDTFLINAAYTFTDSKQNNVEEVRRAKHIGSINTAWQVQGDLKVNINIQHNGTQSDAGKSLPSYNLVNISANYNASNNLDAYINLTNLFDEDYEQVYGYETLGFGANLGVRYKIK
jgi:vitamin B12 transporter